MSGLGGWRGGGGADSRGDKMRWEGRGEKGGKGRNGGKEGKGGEGEGEAYPNLTISLL